MAGYNVREYRFTLSYIAQPIVCGGGGELPVCSMVASLSHSNTLGARLTQMEVARSLGRGINTPINKCTHAARIMLSARRCCADEYASKLFVTKLPDYLLNYSAGCIDFPARTPCQIPPVESGVLYKYICIYAGALRGGIPSGAHSIDWFWLFWLIRYVSKASWWHYCQFNPVDTHLAILIKVCSISVYLQRKPITLFKSV